MVISQAQLDDRRNGIGSSDAAAILGLSSYKTPYDIWLSKTQRVGSNLASEAAWIGSMLETSVLSMAEEKLGRKVVIAPDGVNATFVNGCLRANVDGMVEVFGRGSPIVEAKTTGQLQDWGNADTNMVPDGVLVQVTHQMLCAQSDVCYVARLGAAFGFSFDMFTVPLDRAFADEIQEKLEAWWEAHIVRDTPPEIVEGQLPSFDYLRERKRLESEFVEIPEELVRNEREAKDRLAAADKEYTEAKTMLVCALGDASCGIGGGVRVTVSRVERKGFDTDRLKLEHPDLALQYAKVSSFSRIDIRDVGKVTRAR